MTPARSRIRLVFGDGRLGHAPNAPYDSIVAAAGGEDLPPAWLDQLAVGGRLVAPVHDAGARARPCWWSTATPRRLRAAASRGVLFVPLKSGVE